MRKFIFCIITLLFAIPFFSFADSELNVTISYFNQKGYTIYSDIDIQVRIRNSQITPVSFKLANSRVHNIELDVRNMANDKLLEQDNSIKEFISSQPIYYSDINLKPNEEFSFVIKINDFIYIDKAGDYKTQLYFYTNLREDELTYIKSNVLPLQITSLNPTEKPNILEKIVAKTIPTFQYPNEVVEYIINARIHNNWDGFFHYLNLEKLYLNSGDNNTQFRLLSENERALKINEYQNWLRNGEKDKDLLLIPKNFTIINTTYTPYEAKVTVLKDFQDRAYEDQKQYVYYLEKENQTWKIYDYEITNILQVNQ